MQQLKSLPPATGESSQSLTKSPLSQICVCDYIYTYAYAYVCIYVNIYGLPRWLSDKESACQCRSPGFDPWLRKFSWRRKWQPTLAFLPGKSHGQRSLGDRGATVHGIAKSQKQQLACNVIETAIVVQLLSCDRLFCNPMDCRSPSASVRKIFPTRMLEWTAISFSRGSP